MIIRDIVAGGADFDAFDSEQGRIVLTISGREAWPVGLRILIFGQCGPSYSKLPKFKS